MSFFDERRESARREREGPPARASPKPNSNAVRSGTLPSAPSGPSGGSTGNRHNGGPRDYRSRDNGYDSGRNRDRDRDPRHFNSRDSGDSRKGYTRDHRDHRDHRDNRDNRDNRDRSSRDRRNDGYDYRSNNFQNNKYNDNRHGSYGRGNGGGGGRSRGPALNLDNVTPLNELSREGSLWGVVPSPGYEGASAATAKLSGLFPTPGAPAKSLDDKEVQRILAKFKPKNESNTFEASEKSSPLTSRMSKIAIIDGLDFKLYKANDIKDYIEKLLKGVVLPENRNSNQQQQESQQTSATNEGDDANNTPDKPKEVITKLYFVNSSLILETSETYFATMLFGLNDTKLERFGNSSITVSRPGDYIAFRNSSTLNQSMPASTGDNSSEHETKSESVNSVEDVKRNWIDENADLILISNISKMSVESEIIEKLSSIQNLKSIYYPVETESQDGLGFAICQFVETTENSETLISKISELILDDHQFKASTPCASKYVQTGLVSSDILLQQEGTEIDILPTHHKSKVLEFINCVTVSDLIDPNKYDDLYNSFKEECLKYGQIKELRIPKPSQDFKIWSSELNQPGLGRVYVQFVDENASETAMNGLAGRLFSGRTVFIRYKSERDFELEIY